MKYTFRGINAEELNFKLNRVKIDPNDRIELRPQFARQVRRMNNDPKVFIVALSVKIESTAEEPKPFNLNVTMAGVFEVELASQDEERDFVIQGTSSIYPYLRAAVSNLTASAGIAPLNLPILSGPIFPEDRDVYTFEGPSDGYLN